VGLLVMILGLVLFFVAHSFTTKRKARAAVIARLGERTYKILYSLVSLAGLVLIVQGFGHYREAGIWNVWEPPTFLKDITVVFMMPAVILFVASYIRGRIFAAIKHPMLASITLWAAGHLLANGDLGSIILFGSFLGWAVYDRISLKHRTDSGGPPIPVGGVTKDLIAVAVGVAAYLALAFYSHPVVVGVPMWT
jgi:uncharacterized membrane protein